MSASSVVECYLSFDLLDDEPEDRLIKYMPAIQSQLRARPIKWARLIVVWAIEFKKK